MSKNRKALRVGPIPIHTAKLDRDNLLIRDTVAMQVGEARGHGLWADAKTLHMMAALGNAAKFGVKGRMGHPGMSDNAFAKEVMRGQNFRVVADKLVHDVSFYDWAKRSPAFSQDPVNYIFDRAEQSPESFGESVVVWIEEFWVRPDGSEVNADLEERPDDALYEFPSMRPKEFYYVDFVTDGALTPNGLFSAEGDFWRELFAGTSSEHAEKAFQLLSDFQQQFKLSDDDLALKVPALLNKYTYWKGFQVKAEDNKTPAVVEPVGEGQDALSAALAEADSLFATVQEAPAGNQAEAAPVSGDFVPRAEFDAAQQELAQSREELRQFKANMADYVSRMNSAFKVLSDKVTALSSEPVESNVVPVRGNSHSLSHAPAPVPDGMFGNVVMPKGVSELAANVINSAKPLPMSLAEIEAIADPVAKKKAIDSYNKQMEPNPFGFTSK